MYARCRLLDVKRGDTLVLDGYPHFNVLENHRTKRYFWTYSTENNQKAKIRYEDVDAIYKLDPDTGEFALYYSRRNRDESFWNNLVTEGE